jgi:hypothetical protein
MTGAARPTCGPVGLLAWAEAGDVPSRTSSSGIRADAYSALAMRQTGSLRALPLWFGIFFVAALALTKDPLDYYWFWDDFHLIRVRSLTEVLGAFWGPWDLDGIETPGFRPLSTVYYAVLGMALGEQPRLAHFVNFTALGLYFGLLVLFVTRLGMHAWEGVMAGLFTMSAITTAWSLAWLTDSIRPTSGIPVVLAALFALLWADTRKRRWLVAAVAFAGMGALIREDAIGLWPLVIGGVALRQLRGSGLVLRPAVTVFAALLLLGLSLAVVRRMVVPAAPTSIELANWPTQVYWALTPTGELGQGSWQDVLAATLGCVVLLPLFSAWGNRHTLQLTALWTVCLVLAASSGLVVLRTNNLLFATTFVGLLVATGVGASFERSKVLGVAAVAICLTVGGLAAVQSSLAQESLHVNSIDAVLKRRDMRRYDAKGASISAERLAFIDADLARRGVTRRGDISAWTEMVQAEGRLAPGGEGQTFVPRIGVLQRTPYTPTSPVRKP